MNIRLQQFITRFCILGALLTPSFVWAADIESVRLWRAPDSTRLVLDLSTAAEHNLFALQNPNRLVIDLSDSQLKTQFDKLDLANTPISGIRAAVPSIEILAIEKVLPRCVVLCHGYATE